MTLSAGVMLDYARANNTPVGQIALVLIAETVAIVPAETETSKRAICARVSPIISRFILAQPTFGLPLALLIRKCKLVGAINKKQRFVN